MIDTKGRREQAIARQAKADSGSDASKKPKAGPAGAAGTAGFAWLKRLGSLLVGLCLAPVCLVMVVSAVAALNFGYSAWMAWLGLTVTLPQLAAMNCVVASLAAFCVTAMFLFTRKPEAGLTPALVVPEPRQPARPKKLELAA